jgi:NADPH:quinone reductase
VGCDVVLDAVGGKIGQQAIESAADGHGRVGIYGVASGAWTALDAAQIVQRGLTIIGALGAIFSKSPTEQRADAEHALALAAAGQLRPRIHAIYPLQRATDAHTELQQRRSIGAIPGPGRRPASAPRRVSFAAPATHLSCTETEHASVRLLTGPLLTMGSK